MCEALDAFERARREIYVDETKIPENRMEAVVIE